MTLRLDGSVSSLADSPCTGVCSCTQFGDKRCKGCGRYDFEANSSFWNELDDIQRKLINLRNAAQGFKIRHLR